MVTASYLYKKLKLKNCDILQKHHKQFSKNFTANF